MASGYEIRSAQARPKGRKSLHHIEIKNAKNGGHVVSHHYESDGMAYHKPDEYAFGSGPETVHHLMDHLGVKENEMIAHLKGGDEEEPVGHSGKEEKEEAEDKAEHGHGE